MGSAAASIGGSLVSSAISAKGAKSAAKTQSASADAAMAEQARQFDIAQANQKPFLNTGTAANNQLSILLGLSPTTTVGERTFDSAKYLANNTGLYGDPYAANPYQHYLDYGQREGRQGYWTEPTVTDNTKNPLYGSLNKTFDYDTFEKDPGYQFRMDEGLKALERSQASKGGLLSGAAGKAALTYSQNMGSQEYGNAYNRFNNDQTTLYNRLAGVSGTGQQAANQLGALGANFANQQSSLLTQQGNVNAAGQVGAANAWATGLNQIGNTAQNAYNNKITWY